MYQFEKKTSDFKNYNLIKSLLRNRNATIAALIRHRIRFLSPFCLLTYKFSKFPNRWRYIQPLKLSVKLRLQSAIYSQFFCQNTTVLSAKTENRSVRQVARCKIHKLNSKLRKNGRLTSQKISSSRHFIPCQIKILR